jgi:hypothetical protein
MRTLVAHAIHSYLCGGLALFVERLLEVTRRVGVLLVVGDSWRRRSRAKLWEFERRKSVSDE